MRHRCSAQRRRSVASFAARIPPISAASGSPAGVPPRRRPLKMGRSCTRAISTPTSRYLAAMRT